MDGPAGAVVERVAADGGRLGPAELAAPIRQVLEEACPGGRVLVLVPDDTRNVDLPAILGPVLEALGRAGSVRVLVALGTHPPMAADALARWTGLAPAGGPGGERGGVAVLNHAWDRPERLATLGVVPAGRIREIAGERWHPSLDGDLTVRVNREALEADHIVIVAPTLPHEVAGWSGGAKYLFPGIAGAEMIDVMHWLGALTGVLGTIGVADTPVRRLIDEAAALLPTPVTLLALATRGADVVGLAAGPLQPAWRASLAMARPHHLVAVPRPARRVVSVALPIYDELWTGAKAVYKLAPAVADGGQLIMVAPKVRQVSRTHGAAIARVGYHVLPWFLGQWDRYREEPLAVLAHSTHVKGEGTVDGGREQPRIEVVLATGIPAEETRRLGLGWTDPARLDLEALRRDPETLVVVGTGELLYRPA